VSSPRRGAAEPKGAGRRSPPARPADGPTSIHDVVHAEFLAAIAEPGGTAPEHGPEIAFAGRSNVGKSSLVNALLQRKGLVRTGSTPGLTRQVNLFSLRARDGFEACYADLPGYGFARRGKRELDAWADLVDTYLRTRATLRGLVLLVDLRRGLEAEERSLLDELADLRAAGRPLEAIVVATKIDKVQSSKKKAVLDGVAAAAGLRVLGVSAETGEGVALLRKILRHVASPRAEASPSPTPSSLSATSPAPDEA
jgi:GTP-binding protein